MARAKGKVAAVAMVALGAVAYQIALAAQRRAEEAGAPVVDGLQEPEPWALGAADFAATVWEAAAPQSTPEATGWASVIDNLPSVFPWHLPVVGAVSGAAAAYDALAGQPRGIRNHNPGNIELGDNWQGMRASQSDSRFVQFESAYYGLRAIGIILSKYRARGWNTPLKISEHWAPAADGNNTHGHADVIAKHAGVWVSEQIVGAEWVGAVEGLIVAENGSNPYSRQEILKGLGAGGLV